MLNVKRIFLISLELMYIIFVLVFDKKISHQEILIKSQNDDSLTPSICYDIGVKNRLNLTYDEYIMVCSVVQGETAGADLEWSELVAEVIKNRVNSNEFPNTIYEVLTQPNQFDAIQNYYDNITINYVTYQAVINVFTNQDYLTNHKLKGATYYCNPDILNEDIFDWFNNNLTQTYDAYYYSNGYTYHHTFFK